MVLTFGIKKVSFFQKGPKFAPTNQGYSLRFSDNNSRPLKEGRQGNNNMLMLRVTLWKALVLILVIFILAPTSKMQDLFEDVKFEGIELEDFGHSSTRNRLLF